MRCAVVSLALLTVLFAGTCRAFELATHAAITQNAFERFTGEHSNKLSDLGVYGFASDTDPASLLGKIYYDLKESIMASRHDSPFENRTISDLRANPLSIQGWLMRGAIREDDGYLPFTNPLDDPYLPSILRFLNHFYDPRNDRPLIVNPYGTLGAKAPNWATGAQDVFTDPNAQDSLRRNHFTIFDAQEAMFRALTFKTRDSGGNWVDLASSGAADKQAIRQAYWATTFRALGDVLHLNQDMAQPQHTRNEAHSGAYPANLGHSSFMEKYLDARALLSPSFTIDFIHPVTIETPNPLHFQTCDAQGQNCVAYPLDVSRFTTYRDFWTTSPHGVGGIGLADYSNPGFFTPLKNLGAPENDYDLPPNDPGPANYSVEDIDPTSWNGSPQQGPPIHLLDRAVTDYLNQNQTTAAVRLTSFSIWDEFMQQSNAAPTYHLVRENYDAAERLLLPRAVAYSAGLLSFFFRGSMAISAPDEGVYGIVDHSTLNTVDPLTDFKGFGTIRLKVKNTSPPLANTSVPEPMSGGTLFAVLKFHRNTCYHNDMSDGEPGAPDVDPLQCRSIVEEIVVSDNVPSVTLTDHDQEIRFNFSHGQQLPINATDVYLQLVYRGPLGSESDAVVVATKNISEPTFVTYHNATDYIHLGSTVYKRAELAGNLDLLGAIRPQSCVDYTAQPAQLRSSCFAPGPVTWGLAIGVIPTSLQITGLPPRRLARFAYLSEVESGMTVTQSGTCLPTDPVTVAPLIWQYTYNPTQDYLDKHYTVFLSMRGVYSFYTVACRYVGDDSDAHAPDDLFTKADALRSDSGELTPFPIAITP